MARASSATSHSARQSSMARYDLMHWSQRVRDQQAAARAVQPAPSVLPTPARHPAKPRASRPKPPRDEEAEQLLRLCREGRLFELQAWVAAGKSLSVPAHYRQTPMRIALNTGFHSLIEFLLRHEENQSAKDDVLRQACWSGQRSVIEGSKFQVDGLVRIASNAAGKGSHVIIRNVGRSCSTISN